MYATPSQMLARLHAVELAQLADRSDGALVSADLLRAAVAGEDLSAFTEAEQAAAEAALDVLAQALADAAAEIDAHLQARYTLPLAEVPRVLVAVNIDLARYQLQMEQQAGQVTESVQKKYDARLKFLRAVNSGEVQLGLSPNQAPAAQRGAPAAASSGRVFTVETLRDY